MKSDSFVQKRAKPSNRPSPRLTRNQQAVFEMLKQQPHPCSAQELYAVLRTRQTIGLATVYRALEVLKLQGLIKSRVAVNGESLYSLVAPDQHYLTCLHCGQSFPLDHCPIAAIEANLSSSVSFKIYYHTLEIFGLCEPCTPPGEVGGQN